MLGCKTIAAVFGRKRVAVIECQTKRSGVRLDKNVGNGDPALQIRALAKVAWVLMVADVEPGPSIEGSFTHPGDIVRDKIVAQPIALIGRAPYVRGDRMNGETDAVANTGGEDAGILAVGIECQHGCAIGFIAPACAQRMPIAPRWQA